MPNHITSQVEISGTPAKIKKLIKDTKLVQDNDKEENEFDFNGILPQPKDLFLGNLGEAERKEHGANNWYDWNVANWGTKWGAYSVRYITGDANKIVLQFDTAWASPLPIFAKLEEQGFSVKGVYYGEMDGFEYIGDGNEVFEAYQTVEVEYVG